jgi:flagellar biosynthesis protein FlhF
MKIKKFTARTFAEVLELVKKELGQDAIILSTEEKKGLRPHVEVTAAIDYDQNLSERVRNQADGIRDQITHSSHFTANNGLVTPPSRPTPYRNPPASGAIADDLRSEIGGLRTMIEEMKNSGYELSLPAKKRMLLTFLRERSVRDEFALRLCDTTSEISEIPLMLSADIKIKRHSSTRKAVMLIGPTGVGKTTTIAKLAAQSVKAGKKTAIINLDTYRIGAAEQSRIYARILGIPLAVATSPAEFHSNLSKLSESRDVVFIDTTGKNPKDEAYINDISELCKVAVPLELHLLMSASGDDECMIEAYRSYRNLPIDYIAFTKIDEAVRFGSLYNLLLTYQKPVAYITTGQRVPGDIEYATVKRLANLIVSKECYQC